MAKRFEMEQYGIKSIMRHDYCNPIHTEKINSYRARSVKELNEFLTNVPGSEKFTSFLDVGAGDLADINLFQVSHPDYKTVMGVDKYLDETDYSSYLIKGDWYDMYEKRMEYFGVDSFDVIYINHSMEHAANIYALMEQVSRLQKKGGVLFVAVPEGNSEFGYSITSSTTHYSVLTKGFLSTTLQRFGYQAAVEDREFRANSPELFAFGIRH